jgi:hypothetical protein
VPVFRHKTIISVVNRVRTFSDRMPYIILSGHWCDIIVLNVHVPTYVNHLIKKNLLVNLRIFFDASIANSPLFVNKVIKV